MTTDYAFLKPLSLIYWTKAALGLLAAVICVLLQLDPFTGIVVGTLKYLVGDKILREVFVNKVDEPSIVTKTGLGIYILIWIWIWSLAYLYLR